MYINMGTAVGKPEAHAELLEILHTLARESRSDDGCLSFYVFAGIEDPNHFTSQSMWESEAALDAHMAADHTRAALAAAYPLLATEPKITAYAIEASKSYE